MSAHRTDFVVRRSVDSSPNCDVVLQGPQFLGEKIVYMLSPNSPEIVFKQRFNPSDVAERSYYDDNDICLFMHIPKTAGTSVGKALQASFDVFHSVAWTHVGKSFRAKTKKALYARTRSAQRQVLMGHFSWIEVQYWKNQELPIKLATIIRDPLARFVSNYNYNCSSSHPLNGQFRERFPNMEAYARQLESDHQLNVMIGAFYSFDHALELLCKYYTFIGVTEHLGASLDHLRLSHGFENNVVEYRENTASRPTAVADVSDAVRNIVLERSHNDIRLHKLIMSFYS